MRRSKRVSIPRGYRCQPKYLSILKKSKYMRRWNLRNPWIRPMANFNYAAVLIQSLIRGFITRRRISKGILRYQYKKKKFIPRQLDKYLKCLDYYRKINDKRIINKLAWSWLDNGFSTWCAVRIQAWWKMIPIRRRHLYKKRMVCHISSIIIQSTWRVMYYEKRKVFQRRFPLTAEFREIASRKVQLAWRSFCNRRVFKYFKELICFKLKGAPADLLRSIIPNESDYLDRASGIHVRFRLGGSIFPPKVYFKIFTHRPLCDVNAFAPRDYTIEKPLDPFLKHNKSDASLPPIIKNNNNIRVGTKYFGTILSTTANTTDNWYKREENNEWRPISNQIFDDLDMVPAWARESMNLTEKRKPFHFSTLKRKDDIIKKKKRRKREWMMKAYVMSKGMDPQHALPKIEERSLSSSIEDIISHGSQEKSQYSAPIFNETAAEKFGYISIDPEKGGVFESKQRHSPRYPQLQIDINQKTTTTQTLLNTKPLLDFKKTNKNEIYDDDLLMWSQALDFDDYCNSWSKIATSAPSDAGTSIYNIAAINTRRY